MVVSNMSKQLQTVAWVPALGEDRMVFMRAWAADDPAGSARLHFTLSDSVSSVTSLFPFS